MFFPFEEENKTSLFSVLFTFSFATLLLLGVLLMAFGDLKLGSTLFFLGLVLVAGNEYMIFRRERGSLAGVGVSADIESLMGFTIAACAISTFVGFTAYTLYGWSDRLIFVAFAGIIISTVKILAVSSQLLLTKN